MRFILIEESYCTNQKVGSKDMIVSIKYMGLLYLMDGKGVTTIEAYEAAVSSHSQEIEILNSVP